MKRCITAAISAVLVLGGLVVLAPAASAHHTVVSTSAVECGTTFGTYTITWSIQNWDGGIPGHVTSSSRGVVPVGTSFASNQTRFFTETVTRKQPYTLQVDMEWDNGVTDSNSSTVGAGKFKDCTQSVTATAPTVSNPTCAADGVLTVAPDTVSIDYSASPAGTGPGSYSITASANTGYTISGTMAWNRTVLPQLTGDQCLITATPAAPTVDDPTCAIDGKVVIHATEGVDYATEDLGNYQFRVTATPKAGYKLSGTTVWNLTGLPKLTGTQCDIEVTPVAPAVNNINDCDELGSVTLPTTQGITYELTEGNGTQGPWKVIATAKSGFKFANGATTVFTGNLGTPTTCVTPNPPTQTEPTCSVGGSLEVPVTEGVTYTVEDLGNDTYKVTAAAKSGYKLKGTTVWTLTMEPKSTGPECDLPVTPVAPVVNVIDACDEFGSVTLPSTEGVTYELTNGDGKQGPWEVTATPKAGFKIAQGAQTPFTGNIGTHTTCVTPVAPAVEVINDCDIYGSITLPTTEGVTYALTEGDGKQGNWTVVASTKPGFEFAPNVQTVFTSDLGSHTICVTPVAPTVEVINACDMYGSVSFPNTDGIMYALTEGDGAEGGWKVVASTKPGYEFADGAPSVFTGDLGTHTTCVTPVAPAVNVIDACDEFGSVTLPTTQGVDYELTEGDGKEGPWKVTATAKAGFKIADGATTVFTGNLGSHAICVTPVAPAVEVIKACDKFGSVTLPTTEGVTYELTEGDGKQGNWTVVSSTKPGYEFAPNAQTVFTGDLGQYTTCGTPVAPAVQVINTCDMYGSVTLPTTDGLNYELTEGDGKQGLWEVTATAEAGYTIDAGVQTVFSGNLGQHTICVTPVAPAVNVIDDCDIYGSVTLPTTEGVTYELTVGDGKQGDWKVVASTKPGYEFAPNAQTVFTGDLGEYTTCGTPVAPPVELIDHCDEFGTVTRPTTEGITYELTDGDGKQGAWEVTATAKAGYTINDGVQTVFTGDLGQHTTCVTPVAPAVEVIEDCDMYGSVSFATTEGITYALTEGDGAEGGWKVVASTKPGFEFAPNAQTVFTGDLGTHTTCVTPVAPAVEVIDNCDEFGSVTLPTIEGVAYELTEGDGKEGPWEVTATAKAGHTIADGATTVFTGDLGTRTTCVSPVAPAFEVIDDCDTDGAVTLPTTEGVTYELTEGDGKDGNWKVFASTKPGHEFAPNAQTVFTGALGQHTTCVTPKPPTQTEPTCEAPGELRLPETVGVEYAVEDLGNNTYKVTAAAEEGYELEGTTVWTLTMDPTKTGHVCDVPVTPVAPAVDIIDDCDLDGSVTLPTTEGVKYELTEGDGKTGDWSVTATPNDGFKFDDGVETVFTGDLGEHETCVISGAHTMTDPTCDAPGHVETPITQGVEYTIEDLGEHRFRIAAAAEAGFMLKGTTEWIVTVEPKLTGEQCDTVVTAFAPEVVVLDRCGEYGSIEFPTTQGVGYERTEGNGREGAYRVVASTKPGYRFDDGVTTVFTGDLGEYAKCESSPALPDTGSQAGILTMLAIGMICLLLGTATFGRRRGKPSNGTVPDAGRRTLQG